MGGSISDLVPELQPFARDLVDAAGRAGLQPRITSTIRSHSEQRRLYNRFLAGQAGYPVAPPGQSAHEYGLAFDMVVSPMEALADVGYTWQTWGGGWNGSDAVHFELPGASEWARSQPSEDISSFTGYFGAETKGVIDYIKANAPTAFEISSIFNVPIGIATTLWSLFSKK
jgi:hypothetical protein